VSTTTAFRDMYSGGSRKTDYDFIYIQAQRRVAERAFAERFKRDPRDTSCVCCGRDFAVKQYESLKEATEYERSRGGSETPLSEYVERDDVLVVEEVTDSGA